MNGIIVKCAQCKWWENAWYSKTIHLCGKVTGPEYDKDGFRKQQKNDTLRFEIQHTRDCPAFLETGPEFGCVHGEAK
jgi:hypothetical protein